MRFRTIRGVLRSKERELTKGLERGEYGSGDWDDTGMRAARAHRKLLRRALKRSNIGAVVEAIEAEYGESGPAIEAGSPLSIITWIITNWGTVYKLIRLLLSLR